MIPVARTPLRIIAAVVSMAAIATGRAGWSPGDARRISVSPSAFSPTSVSFGGGLFLALRPDAEDSFFGKLWSEAMVAAASRDGVTWERVDGGFPNRLLWGPHRAIHADGRWLLLTQRWTEDPATLPPDDGVRFSCDALLTSSNGRTWAFTADDAIATLCELNADPWFIDAAWADGRWVAMGSSGRFLTSTNGDDWTPGSLGKPYDRGTIEYVAHGDGRWVAGGRALRDSLHVSVDGVKWTTAEAQFPVYPSPFRVLHSGGRWVALTETSILASNDLQHWDVVWDGEQSAGAGTAALRAIAHDAALGRWTAVGSRWSDALSRSVAIVLTSTDLASWEEESFKDDSAFIDVAAGDGLWSVVGEQAPDPLHRRPLPVWLTSSNGVDWSRHTPAAPLVTVGAGWENGQWFIAGAAVPVPGAQLGIPTTDQILSTTDGAAWTPRLPTASIRLTGSSLPIKKGGGKWLVFGRPSARPADVVPVTSANGIDWSISPDAITGLIHPSGGGFGALAHGDGLWMIGGYHYVDGFYTGILAISADAVHWEIVRRTPEMELYEQNGFSAIHWHDGLWVAVNGSEIHVSNDARSWTVHDSGLVGGNLADVHQADGLWVAVGSRLDGYRSVPAILTSEDGATWISREAPAFPVGNAELHQVGRHQDTWIISGLSPEGWMLVTSSNGIDWDHRIVDWPTEHFASGGEDLLFWSELFNLTLVSPAGSPAHPTLTLHRTGESMTLRASGTPGATWELQYSRELLEWQNVGSVILDAETLEIDLGSPDDSAGYWRLAKP